MNAIPTLPVLPDPDHPGRGPLRRLRYWTWAHRLSAASFMLLIILGSTGWISWFQGSPTAARWVGILPLVDPLAGLEVGLASGQGTQTMLLGMAICLSIGLLLGRVFCGWICPLGLMLELNVRLRLGLPRLLKRFSVQLPTVILPASFSYFILLFCLGVSLFAGLPTFTMVSPINLLTLAPSSFPGLVALLVLPLLLVEWFVPRGFCRALCPLGGLYALVGRWALLRVRVVGRERPKCQRCTLHCPMGIPVMEEHVLAGADSIRDPHCTRCGTCTDVCLGGVLRLGFPRKVSVSGGGAVQRRSQ